MADRRGGAIRPCILDNIPAKHFRLNLLGHPAILQAVRQQRHDHQILPVLQRRRQRGMILYDFLQLRAIDIPTRLIRVVCVIVRLQRIRHEHDSGLEEKNLPRLRRDQIIDFAEALVVSAAGVVVFIHRNPMRVNRFGHDSVLRIAMVASLPFAIDENCVVAIGGCRVSAERRRFIAAAAVVEQNVLSARPDRQAELVLMDMRVAERADVKAHVIRVARPT